MEIQRTAGASTYVVFPMISPSGAPQTGLAVVGSWLAWADTARPASQSFRPLSGSTVEIDTSAVYQCPLASTELPVASPYVMLRFATAGIATQYLLIRTATLFANMAAVTAGAITSGAFASGAITAASIAADAITDAKVASDVTIASVTGAVGSVTGAVGSVTGLTASDVGAIKAKTDNLPSDPADASVVAGLIAGVDAKVDIIDTNVDSILVDTGEIGTAGAGLTNINLPDQTMNITGDITGNLSGSVGSVGAGGIATTSFAAGAIDAAAIAANAIGAAELAADGASEYADAFLGRTIDRSGSGGRTVSQALMALRNKVSISAGTLTVTGVDDTTSEWTATIATQAVTAIVTSIDPA